MPIMGKDSAVLVWNMGRVQSEQTDTHRRERQVLSPLAHFSALSHVSLRDVHA